MSEHNEDPILIVPFTCVESVGGPFDDKSFVAGWQMGGLSAIMEKYNSVWTEENVYVYPELEHQLDLIAMNYGLKTEKVNETEDFIVVKVTKSEEN